MTTAIEWVKIFFTYVGWWLIPLLIIFIYRKRLDKYPIIVTIFEKRGENIVYSNDVAGRFDNPVVCYRLKKNKDSIPIPKYDWVLQSMYKPTNLFEKVSNLLSGKIGQITLFKYGSKQYKPVKIKMPDGSSQTKWKLSKDQFGDPIMINVYEAVNVKPQMSCLNFEVIDWDDINHMTQELRAIATRRSPLVGFLEKHGPLIAIVLAILALIIAGYYYKEMILDAGGKLMAASNQNNNVKVVDNKNPIAEQPNIPIAKDLFNPPTS